MDQSDVSTPMVGRAGEGLVPAGRRPAPVRAADELIGADPAACTKPGRHISRAELVRAIRRDLLAEQEAVQEYLARLDSTGDPLVESVLRDIADEERTHVNEFARLLGLIAPEEGALLAVRVREADAPGGTPAKEPAGRPPASRGR